MDRIDQGHAGPGVAVAGILLAGIEPASAGGKIRRRRAGDAPDIELALLHAVIINPVNQRSGLSLNRDSQIQIFLTLGVGIAVDGKIAYPEDRPSVGALGQARQLLAQV